MVNAVPTKSMVMILITVVSPEKAIRPSIRTMPSTKGVPTMTRNRYKESNPICPDLYAAIPSAKAIFPASQGRKT